MSRLLYFLFTFIFISNLCKAELQNTNKEITLLWNWPVTNGYNLNNVSFILYDIKTYTVLKEFKFYTNSTMDGKIVSYKSNIYELSTTINLEPNKYSLVIIANSFGFAASDYSNTLILPTYPYSPFNMSIKNIK